MEALIAEARRGRGPHSNLRTRPDTFGELQSNHRILAGPGQAARWAGHIVSVEGRPAVVAAMTIVPNINTNLLKGTPNLLVGIKYIDEAFISDIGRSLLLSDLALIPEPARHDAIVSEPFVGDDGIPVGYLTWTTLQPGQVLLTIILPLVAFGVFATGMLSNTILRRLRRASKNWRSEKHRPGMKRSTMRFPGCRTACTWLRKSTASCKVACLRPTTIVPSPLISMSIASRTSMTRSAITPATN